VPFKKFAPWMTSRAEGGDYSQCYRERPPTPCRGRKEKNKKKLPFRLHRKKKEIFDGPQKKRTVTQKNLENPLSGGKRRAGRSPPNPPEKGHALSAKRNGWKVQRVRLRKKKGG